MTDAATNVALNADAHTAMATAAAALLGVDPAGLGGCVLRACAGPHRDAWLAELRAQQPAAAPWRHLPTQASDEQLLGGLDIAATLRLGQAVQQAGLLAQARGGVIVAAMAERMPGRIAARLSSAMDDHPQRTDHLTVIALDEGGDDDERPPAALLDRLAFHVDLRPTRGPDVRQWMTPPSTAHHAADASTLATASKARELLSQVTVSDELLTALAAAADALGVASMRALHFALRATRASAALDGRNVATSDDASLAVQLVFAPRATQLPPSDATQETPAPSEATPAEPHAQPPTSEATPEAPRPTEATSGDTSEDPNKSDDSKTPSPTGTLEDQWIEAAKALIPPGLLAAMMVGAAAQQRGAVEGRSGATSASRTRGRPLGARRGDPRSGARLALIDTLRAAAPWQAVRRAQASTSARVAGTQQRIFVRREDLHVMRYQQHRATTMVFVIDASGSSALHRLAEAKGAVELLLADCYVRRDSVAVIGFRGRDAQLLLPPTRSLVRAKRSLAGLPGGGGTPLAAGINAAAQLADQVARGGATPLLVFLTDGRANVARDGSPGRPQAQQDAQHVARDVRASRWASVVIDTSPRPEPAARDLAAAMGARYVALPHAGATELSNTVRLATVGGSATHARR
jgi:magnesium chelatase subunit D